MNPELLTQEEINALIETFGTRAEGRGKSKGPAREVRIYDFARPDRLSKERMRTLQMIHGACGRLLSTALSTQLRQSVRADLVSVDQMTWDEFAGSIPEPSVIGVFGVEPLAGDALLEISPVLALAIVDRLLGGSGEVSGEARDLTEIEKALLGKVMDRMMGCFAESWSALASIKPRRKDLAGGLSDNPIGAASESVFLACYDLRIGSLAGDFQICLPISALEPVLVRLNAQDWFSARRGGSSGVPGDALEAHLHRVKVEGIAVLGRVKIAIRELIDLQVGDLIRLDSHPDAPVEMVIGGRTRFLGRPGLVGRRMAVQIAQAVDAEEENVPASSGDGPEERVA